LEKGLEKIKKGEGALLAIHGKPCSGKTSLINRVFSEDEDIEFLELDGQFSTLVHVKSKLKSVDKFLEKVRQIR
jgi:AAA+ ATPase superfamily predicted ATPase